MEVLDQVRQNTRVPLGRLEPEIRANRETICMKCLEREPVKRYSSASALAADLRRFLENKPILARPVGPMARLILWSRRNKIALGAAALLVGVVGLTWFGAGRWQTYRQEAQERERVAREKEWKEFQEARSERVFEKLLTDGPSAWPMPAEEKLVFQNGVHDLQVRKNRASLRNSEAEGKALQPPVKPAVRCLETFKRCF